MESEENGVKLLTEAVTAHREALKVRMREQFPQQWARTQNNLGNALLSLGERTKGEGSARPLGEAVTAFREALKVIAREQSPLDWAMTQNNLGNALMLQGVRTAEPGSARLLAEAVTYYSEVLKVYTREQFPRRWAQAQDNLAGAYFLLHNWVSAAESYRQFLTIFPDYEASYGRLSTIYHDKLFKFEEAFTLNQQWMVRHPNDISAQADFTEKHFTTGRFDECEQRINALLAKPEVSSSAKPALRAIEIANLLALNQSDKVPSRLEMLIAEISRQPGEFKVGWVFDGTRHFISQNEKLSTYRDWLGSLFDALAGKDRETILRSLREVQKNFR